MAAHAITRCRFCRVVINACRCMGPHDTVWSGCGACLQRVATGEVLRDVSKLQPMTREELEGLRASADVRSTAAGLVEIRRDDFERLLDTAELGARSV